MIIKVKVKPSSKENKITKLDNNSYEISVKEKPINNAANIAVIRLLSKHFNISHKKIKIKNLSSREKTIEII